MPMRKYVWGALPLVLLLAGCTEKTESIADGMTTNAAIVDADNTAKNPRDRNVEDQLKVKANP